jgi:hypothetical protein
MAIFFSKFVTSSSCVILQQFTYQTLSIVESNNNNLDSFDPYNLLFTMNYIAL